MSSTALYGECELVSLKAIALPEVSRLAPYIPNRSSYYPRSGGLQPYNLTDRPAWAIGVKTFERRYSNGKIFV